MILDVQRLAAVLLGLCVSSSALAELKWEKTTIELKPDLAAEVVEANFPFTNAGKTSVAIVEIKPACECTTAKLEKRIYQPGESGQIHVSLRLPKTAGTVPYSLQVFSDDTMDQPVFLTLLTTIPSLITLSPPTLTWKIGEEPAAKEALITINPSVPKTRVIGVRSENKSFEAALQTEPATGHQYLVVRPRATVTAAQEFINIDSQPADGIPARSTIAIVRIR